MRRHIYNTKGHGANVRSDPSHDAQLIGHISEGTAVNVHCQIRGDKVSDGVHESDIWDSVDDGAGTSGWVSDLYVDTENVGDFSPSVPRC